MPEPAVRCRSCAFAWNSRAMAEGLRLLQSCPKCGGELQFRDGDGTDDGAEPVREVAPHLVLGLPRLPY